jgi:hypothetical protein
MAVGSASDWYRSISLVQWLVVWSNITLDAALSVMLGVTECESAPIQFSFGPMGIAGNYKWLILGRPRFFFL